MIEKVGEVYAIPPVYIIINKCDLIDEDDDDDQEVIYIRSLIQNSCIITGVIKGPRPCIKGPINAFKK